MLEVMGQTGNCVIKGDNEESPNSTEQCAS